jgi:hypothetical protein
MRAVFRYIYNTIYRSAHRFSDGSSLYHMIRYDIVRYYSGDGFHRIVDLPIIYEKATGLSRIDSDAIWRWRDPQVPLGEPSGSGLVLTEAEKLDLYQKLPVFIAKQGQRFEPLRISRR